MPGAIHVPMQHPAASSTYTVGRFRKLRRFWGEIEIPFLILAGFISIILGTLGFQQYYSSGGEPYTPARCLYASLELLDFMGGNIAAPIPWPLEIARWLSPAVTMYAVLLGLAAVFQTQVQMLRLRLASNHIIICGLGQKGLLLAKNLREADQSVAVIDRDGNNPNITICRDLGAIVLLGDARDEFILRKAGVMRARHLISVCAEDGTNAEVAVKARRLVANRATHDLTCAIHIRDPKLWVFLRRQEFSADQTPTFRLDFFNVYDHGARQLLHEYPIIVKSLGKATKAPHLLLVDLGPFGQQLVVHAARQWCPSFDTTSKQLRISVVDPQAQPKIESLCLENSLVRRVCKFTPYSIDISSPEFQRAEFLSKNRSNSDISYVYVCLEDESVGVSGALSLLQKTQRANIQILVRMSEDAGLASLLSGHAGFGGSLANLHAFGLLERTCKPSLLNDGSHESLARAIHEEYVLHEMRKGSAPDTNRSMVAWDQLSDDLKRANRQQADDIGKKLSAVDCDVVPWADYSGDKFLFKPAEIEMMAKIEHERWCQQRSAQGWKYAPVRNDEKKEHPSLLAWDDPRFGEVEKNKDRNTSKKIPHFLALAGFQIYRVAAPESP